MLEEKHAALVPRCKLEALRIRQRKGLRPRKKGRGKVCQQYRNYTHTGHHRHHHKEIQDAEDPDSLESETLMLAKRYDGEVLGLEVKDTEDEADFSPDSPDYDIIKMDQASIEARKAEWDIKSQKSKAYVQRYIDGTLLSPQSRHSSTVSDDSSQICREVEERAQRISNSYGTLHEILLRHEPTIQARWSKKRPGQKEKLLRELWPGMPKMHRPEFYAFRCTGGQKRVQKYRDWYMWPYINQHDLTMRDSLLLLITSRGFCNPSKFVDGDMAAMKFGLEMGVLKSVSLTGYSMVLLEADNLENYGKLIDISAYSEMETLDLDKKQISPYYGILILEAQDRLMKFLVDCCKKILHDIPDGALISDDFPILAGAPKILSDTEVYDPAVIAAEAPYRVPAKPNFKQIGVLLGAKMAETKDHLLNLREDPVYFANAMMVMKDHSPRELEGETGAYFVPLYERLDLSSDLAFVIGKVYGDFEVFADLYEQVQQLERLHAEYETGILPFKEVPDEILAALSKYQICLWDTVNTRRLALRKVVRNSPAWSRHFSDDGISLASFQSDVGNFKSSSVRRHLMLLLQCITDFDPKLPSLANAVHLVLPLIMDEIETLREHQPEAWELTSSLTGEIIDELAILAQCMEQVDMYLRRTRSYKSSILESEYKCVHQINKKLEHIYCLNRAGADAFYNIAVFAEVNNKKLVYPWDKRRTKENVEAMQKAERDLDQFWDAADSFMCSKIKGFRESLLGQHICGLHDNLRRTPDWIEEKESKVPRPVRQRNASLGDGEVYKPPFAPCVDQSASLGKPKQDRHCIQPKIKTKGQAHKAVTQPGASPVSPISPVEEAVPEVKPLVPVDTRALKVFRALFYNPDVTSSPGEVPWKDLVHAMVCTGFSAQKLQGSMWQFSRVHDDGQQTILFHEPHPHKKVPFYVARSIGWRLNRHFEWTLRSFELKKKQTEVLE